MFWILNIILQNFPKQCPTIVFSQNKLLHQFLDIKFVQNVFVQMAQRNVIQAHLTTSGPCVRFQSS